MNRFAAARRPYGGRRTRARKTGQMWEMSHLPSPLNRGDDGPEVDGQLNK